MEQAKKSFPPDMDYVIALDTTQAVREGLKEIVKTLYEALSNLLRLLELADEIKTLVEHRQLEMGHARALLGLPQARQQSEVGALVARKGLSVRETEALVKRMLAHGDKANRKDDGDELRPDPNITRLEQDLADRLGARVSLQHARTGKGKLVIAYNSLDELDGIHAHIK